MKEDPVSRRSFLARAAILFGGAASVGGGYLLLGRRPRMKNVMLTLREDNLLINPAFRSIEATDGRLELFTYLASGEKLSHTFSGVEAELLSALKSRSHVTGIIATLATRYGMSEAECRSSVADSLVELNSAGVVLFGNTQSLTIVETGYERTVQGNV